MSGGLLGFLLTFLALWLLGMAFTAWRFATRRGAGAAEPLPAPLPRVSILIAARDEEAALPRCLASLRALNYPAELLEILVGDDASTDGTAAVAASLADTARSLGLDRPQGLVVTEVYAGGPGARAGLRIAPCARA